MVGYSALRKDHGATVFFEGANIVAIDGNGGYIDHGIANVDDDIVIQSALTAVSATQGMVSLGEGTFMIRAKLTIPTYVSLIGQGPGTYLYAADGLNDNMIELSNTQGNVIADIWMDGNASEQTSGHGINITHTSSALALSQIRNVNIYGCKECGISISANSNNVTVSDSTIIQCKTAQICDSTTTSDIHNIFGYAPVKGIRDTVSNILEILGDVRAFIPCSDTSGNTLTDYSYHGHNGTALHDLYETYGTQGKSGYCYLNSGTPARAIYIADNADFSFGNSLTDDAFSVMAVFKRYGLVLQACHIISKRDDGANAMEWWVEIAAGSPSAMTFECYDQSVPAYINVVSNVIDWNSPPTDGWNIMVATYDGSGVESGLTIYLNGTDVSNTHNINGAYVAMENLTSNVGLGCKFNSGTVDSLITADTTWFAITGKELDAGEVWSVTQRILGALNI